MNEFHFRVVDGRHSVDDVKLPLKNLEAARDHAVSIAMKRICTQNTANFDGGAVIVEVYGLAKEPLLNIRLVLDVERVSEQAP